MSTLKITSGWLIGGLSWNTFREKLGEGDAAASLVLLGLLFGIAVVLRAGVNLLRKETGR